MTLDNFRRIDMQINRANDYQIETQFVKEGDYNGRELVVQITDAGEVSNQSGVSLNLGWKHNSAGNSGLDPFTVVDASKGIFKITYPTEMLIAGDVTASIQVLESGRITLTRNFKITIENNPIDEGAIVSENSFTVLQEALIKVNDLEDNYAPRLNEVTTQLAHIHYDVKNEGAIGDGITDDTEVIQAVLNKTTDGDTIYFPNGEYLVTKPLLVENTIKIEMQGSLQLDHNLQGIIFKSPAGNFSANATHRSILDVELNVKRIKDGVQEFFDTAIGVEMWNVYKGKIHLKNITGNHTGVKFIGDQYKSNVYAGFSYCNITIGLINSQKINILAETVGSEGYFTQNQFYSGNLTTPINDALEPTHLVMNNKGTSVINENTFFGVSFEGGAKIGIKLTKATANKFISCRFEMPRADKLFIFENSRFNRFSSSDYVARYMYEGKYEDNVNSVNNHLSNTVIEFEYHLIGYVIYYDRKYYVLPQRNIYETNYPNNNGARNLPAHWDYEIIKNGYTDSYRDIRSTIKDRMLILNTKSSDHFIVSMGLNDPIDRLMFEIRPAHSKEIRITLRYSQKSYPITCSNEFSGITDLTGNDGVIPENTTAVKLFYNHYKNRFYIENVY